MYSNILKRELHFDDSGHERLNLYRLDCGYISEEDFNYFNAEYILVGKMINGMIRHSEKFTPGHSATAAATATNTFVEIKPKESK